MKSHNKNLLKKAFFPINLFEGANTRKTSDFASCWLKGSCEKERFAYLTSEARKSLNKYWIEARKKPFPFTRWVESCHDNIAVVSR